MAPCSNNKLTDSLRTAVLLMLLTAVFFSGTGRAQPAPAQWMAGMPPAVPADSTWLENIQLGTVRLGTCTATFVSATGLMATSYQCAYDHVRTAWNIEDIPLAEGFYAPELFDERSVPGLVADHLLEVREADRTAPSDTIWESTAGTMVTEFRPSADTTRYLAYTYQRYSDVRVVMIPEKTIATFGDPGRTGTYPRYSLGIGFLRVYDDGGHPVLSEAYLPITGAHIRPGDPLYSIGIDETGLPRIGVGSAQGPEGNASSAPPYTTLFGLFDLHYAHGAKAPWALSEPWLESRDALDLSAQLNMAATTPCPADGSPLVNVDLEVLSIAFDDSGPRPDGRCISVVGTGILSALRGYYQATMLVAELEEEGLSDYAK